MASHLEPIIREIAEQLDFLPIEKISEVIANMIIDVLPFAILEMEDASLPSRQEMKSAEFKTRRSGGKDKDEINEEIENRRTVYEEVMNAKSAIVTEYASQGMVLLALPLKDHTAMLQRSTTESSLNNVPSRYQSRSELLNTMAEEDSAEQQPLAKPRGSNLRYVVDEPIVSKINNDHLFRLFCSTVEEAARSFASVHKNEWIFTLKESRDPESQSFLRTILFIQFPRVHFDTSLKLWSTLSSVVRNYLEEVQSHLEENERSKFKELVSNFNVVLDY